MTISSIAEKINSLKKEGQTLLVAIDGRGGSGKSTFAHKLQGFLENATIVQLDNFAYPNGGVDRQRVLDQVILPLKSGREAKYQRFDWKTQKLEEWHTIVPGGIVIIEGVLVLHDSLAKYYDIKIWLECPPAVGFARGVKRDKEEYGVDTTRNWLEEWMPEEKQLIAEQNPQQKADIVIQTEK